MENYPNFEQGEKIIDGLIDKLAEREGVNPDDILSDIITFAPYKENDDPNPDYLDEVAEKLGISRMEMCLYAIKKATDH